jgi:hypothetical protein
MKLIEYLGERSTIIKESGGSEIGEIWALCGEALLKVNQL